MPRKTIDPVNSHSPTSDMLDRLSINQKSSDIREYENGDYQYDITTEGDELELNPLFKAFNALALPTTAFANMIGNQKQKREEDDEMIRSLQPQTITNYENRGLINRVQPYAEEGGRAGLPDNLKGFNPSMGMIPYGEANYQPGYPVFGDPTKTYSAYRTDHNKKYIPYGEENKDKSGVNSIKDDSNNLEFKDKIKGIFEGLFREPSNSSVTPNTDPWKDGMFPESKIDDGNMDPFPPEVNSIDKMKEEMDKIVYPERK